MQIVAVPNLACPIDGLPIAAQGTVRRCAAGHSYDMAREGYCNLLVVQHKSSRDPGDGKDKIAARRRFLEAGHYEPIAARTFEVARDCMAAAAGGGPFSVFDAGCGEGYYLDRLARSAAASPDSATLALAGIDVSKWAIKSAARRAVPVTWLVANNRNPPFLPASVDLIACLFGFPVWEGFKGVQKPGGHVLLVEPGADHLIELRQIIYPAVNRSPPPPLAAAEATGYRLKREEGLRYTVTLAGTGMIQDLLAMTPHAHRVPQDRRNALAELDTLTVTVDVAFRLLALDETQ